MRPVIFIRPICLPKTPHYIPLWQRHVEYPKFTPGDPPVRTFLPPFWMKMLYPGPTNPPDHVVFKVHPQMTRSDVRQYLEKIYDVPVMDVRLKMVYHDLEPVDKPQHMSLMERANPLSVPPPPERYEKVAYVRLLPGNTFEFPNLFEQRRPSDLPEELDQPKHDAASSTSTKLDSTTLPTWFLQ